MKIFVAGFVAAIAIVAIAFTAYQYGTSRAAKPAVPTPTAEQAAHTSVSPTAAVAPSTAEPTSEDITAAISEALIKKNNWDPKIQLEITVKTNDGKYASGGVTEKGAMGGGGMFFATKVQGVWKIVADGNGIAQCSELAPYPDFPTSLIPQCWDVATNKLVTR